MASLYITPELRLPPGARYSLVGNGYQTDEAQIYLDGVFLLAIPVEDGRLVANELTAPDEAGFYQHEAFEEGHGEDRELWPEPLASVTLLVEG